MGSKISKKKYLILIISIVLTSIAIVAIYPYINVKFSTIREDFDDQIQYAKITEFLNKSTTGELYLLNPETNEGSGEHLFNKYPILQRIPLSEADFKLSKVSVIAALDASPKYVAACFNPRHGLKLKYEGREVDFVICYECSKIYIVGLEQPFYFPIKGNSDVLDSVLQKNQYSKKTSNE